MVWFSHLFQNFPQFIVIHTVKGFGIVNKAEIDVFLELSCFSDDPADVGNLISGSSAFSKTSLNIWKFMVHVVLKPGLENFEHSLALPFFGISFLTCLQISQEAGKVVWYSRLLKNFPQFVLIHTVKGFGIVNKAEVDVFLELFCFLDDPTDVGNLISGSSVFPKFSLNIWKFTVHVVLKPGLENSEHYFTSM